MSKGPDPKALADLGFDPHTCRSLRELTFERRVERVDELKRQAKVLYRAKAREIHPDRHGGDPARVEELAKLNHAYSMVQRVRAEDFVPIQAPAFSIVFGGVHFSTSTNNSGMAVRIILR